MGDGFRGRLTLRGGWVYRPDGTFRRGDVVMERGVFQPAGPFDGDGEALDAEGLYLIPGLTDIHLHGCAGHDFCEGTPEAFQAILDYEERAGVTTVCLATMTLPEADLLAVASSARAFIEARRGDPSGGGAELAGIHLEGPFLSPARAGAQNPAFLRDPDLALYRRLQAASGGRVRVVTLAPERAGALGFIAAARGEALLSLGHTEADYATARAAFQAGARHVTHLYNAMPPIGHRAPGLILAAADTEGVGAELICDGIHVHPAAVRNALRMFGPGRVIFVSDSMAATGMPDGRYTLGGQPVVKAGRRATLEDGRTLAGSVTNLMDGLRAAVLEMGIPLETAVRCAAVNPARAIGLGCGSIEPGRAAHLAVLDKGLNLVMAFCRGRLARHAEGLGINRA